MGASALKQSALEQNVRDIWTDAYRFHATFDAMGNSVEEWQKCLNTMEALRKKYHDHPLAAELFMAVYSYLNDMRVASGQDGGGGDGK